MEPTKRAAILAWKSPLTNAKQVRQFIELVSYYRSFIPSMSTIAEPLTRLTQRRTRVEWGEAAAQAMEKLKQAVVHG